MPYTLTYFFPRPISISFAQKISFIVSFCGYYLLMHFFRPIYYLSLSTYLSCYFLFLLFFCWFFSPMYTYCFPSFFLLTQTMEYPDKYLMQYFLTVSNKFQSETIFFKFLLLILVFPFDFITVVAHHRHPCSFPVLDQSSTHAMEYLINTSTNFKN